jgi:hypothetical protein
LPSDSWTTINGFYTSSFSEATFHIVLSALATLPCEFVKLRRDVSEGSHFEHEALKNLMLSPSLRRSISYFLGPLSGIGRPSRTINVAWLCFDCCSIPDGSPNSELSTRTR